MGSISLCYYYWERVPRAWASSLKDHINIVSMFVWNLNSEFIPSCRHPPYAGSHGPSPNKLSNQLLWSHHLVSDNQDFVQRHPFGKWVSLAILKIKFIILKRSPIRWQCSFQSSRERDSTSRCFLSDLLPLRCSLRSMGWPDKMATTILFPRLWQHEARQPLA